MKLLTSIIGAALLIGFSIIVVILISIVIRMLRGNLPFIPTQDELVNRQQRREHDKYIRTRSPRP